MIGDVLALINNLKDKEYTDYLEARKDLALVEEVMAEVQYIALESQDVELAELAEELIELRAHVAKVFDTDVITLTVGELAEILRMPGSGLTDDEIIEQHGFVRRAGAYISVAASGADIEIRQPGSSTEAFALLVALYSASESVANSIVESGIVDSRDELDSVLQLLCSGEL